jgi:hypothetical protein
MSLLLLPLSWRSPVGMLRNIKFRSRLLSRCVLTFLSAIGIATASDEVPAGYKADRYQKVWERNPFTIVTPVAALAQPKVFDKLVLLSWLNDGGKDVVFVQNIETNEVQRITTEGNGKSLRLVAIHKAADPKNAEVVLSDGTEEGSVKFRLETPAVAPQSPVAQQPAIPTPGLPNPVPGMQTTRGGANQQGAVPMQPPAVGVPPRASEIRRKRITPPPVTQQPVGAPTPIQNPGQPQTQ